jgi:NADH-ubiquinone oxidoreductase chain 1
MTEHAAVIFVFFFLAEYGSILLMCILTSIFFMGGYLFCFSIDYILNFIHEINLILNFYSNSKLAIYDFLSLNYSKLDYYYINNLYNRYYVIINILYGLALGLKTSIIVFIFIWVRASFPRVRFDQLMSFCWIILLPILFGIIVLVPCILYEFNIMIIN